MTTSSSPLQVFLAHSSHDKKAVRDIYHLLNLDGFAPWLDEVSLVPGQDGNTKIKRAVQTSQAVAVFLSRNSMDRDGYVHKEIALALDYAERQREGSIFVIPIRLEDCTVPDRRTHLHWVELPETGFSLGQAYLRLQRSLTVRAMHEQHLTSLPVTEPWMEILRAKRIPDSYPVGNLDDWYLVRGENPDGSRYYGLGNITLNDDVYTLTEKIGAHEVVYDGRLEESTLIFAGKGYTVSYTVGRNDGVLLGTWGEGGVEELIPASPFSKPKQRIADST